MPGITDPTEAYFKDGQWGWDLTQWRKQPLVFGYSDTLGRDTVNPDLPATAVNVDTGTCPASYVWVVTNLSFRYYGTPPTSCAVGLSLSGSFYWVFNVLLPASGQYYDRQGWWVLKTNDFVRLTIDGPTLHDVAAVTISGFAMAIAE